MMGPIVHCRMCLWPVEPVLDLEPTPIANAYSESPEVFAMRYPLGLTQCTNHECEHVQIGFNIDGDMLYGDYRYQTPEAERARLSLQAVALARKYPHALKQPQDRMPKVIEIGSNNGIFVNELNRAGFFAAGVDPSPHAPKTGMPKWFSTKTARAMAFSMGKMKLIVSNNTFAHVDDLRNVMLGVKYLLDDDGYLVFEVQYLPALIRGGTFDMIYHEHKDYHTLKPWVRLLKKFGMCIREVEHIPTHGGSIRVTVAYGEESINVSDPAIDWADIRAKIAAGKSRIEREINGHAKLAAFGATAKATTLIHQYGLADRIAYFVDETPTKVGRFMPGTSIPIYGFGHLKEDAPDAVLLTAWNYAEVIKPRLHGIPTINPFSTT